MAQDKPISKGSMGTRLFSKNEIHIKKMVKKNGSGDKRFKDDSAAIRYYVELGIAAENNAVEASENLVNSIFRRDQKQAVAEHLSPLAEAINILWEAVKTLDANQADYFTRAEEKFEKLESRFGRETNNTGE